MSAAEAAAPGQAAPLFAALGDPTRLGVLARLCADGPLSLTALSGSAPISRQALRKHLEVLAGAGLVRSSRHGRERLWRFQPQGLDPARQHLDALSRRWDEALERLRRLVEG